MTTVGVVLAAGGGTRFGRPKAAVEVGGETLAVRSARAARRGGCDEVVVVVGPVSVDLDPTDQVIRNDGWASGVGGSLTAGLDAAADLGGDRALVVLCDQPWIGAPVIRAVLDAAPRGRAALAATTFDGRRSHPVLLGADHWAGVRDLALGDVGARPYLERHRDDLVAVAADGLGDPADIDRPDDLPG
ncbi:MAG TPA: nucleotidyltransferase family protein [Aquihabitans sp.]|nr:nucleotidyltransferase family protein [Aquihabitans sp.]